MRKHLIYIMMTAFAASMLFGCQSSTTSSSDSEETQASGEDSKEEEEADGEASDASESETETDTTPSDSNMQTYESKDGWKVSYNPSLIQCNEPAQDGDPVDFVYTGESAGTDMISISYVADKMPEEVLYDATQDYDQEKLVRSEGYFGADNDWSFTRMKNADDDGSGLYETYTAVEHNGGSILIDSVTHVEEDDNRMTAISDTLAEVLDTMELINHQPQAEYSYVPGTYVYTYQEEIEGKSQTLANTLVLNADHTGTLSAQDDVDIYWMSTEIEEAQSGRKYEYTIEGDTLMLNLDDNWLSFERQKE